jgi:predicted ATPase
MDVDALAPGVEFEEAISVGVAASDVLLALIGRCWADEVGRRRLHDPHDLVRREIETALAAGVAVVPVLIEDAEMPLPEALPESISGLARRHASVMRHATWTSDLARLVEAVEAAPPGTSTNLPVQPSSFLGREAELAEATELLASSRLVTVRGPGGIGKTRFAIELARQVQPRFADGVVWVPLANTDDPRLALEAAAQAAGAQDGLADHIRDKRMLLVLDNLEQVIGAASDLSALLAACPRLTLLVTSRELLRVRGEREYALPPLASDEAVRLFCERAGTAPEPTITELCVLLEGVPLAIELAAARATVLSPGQILDRLSGALDLFRGGRDADPRQQTLRATIEWSHDLLTPDEQRLFADFSVFVGGCTVDAAEQVTGAAFDVIESLVDKSLLGSSRGRLSMLRTVRAFASERRDALGPATDLRRRHAAYFLAFAEQAQGQLAGPDQEMWLDRLGAELDNFRSTLEWFQREGEIESELRLLAAPDRLWFTRMHPAEARRRFDEALSRAPAGPSLDLARVLIVASMIACDAGDPATGKKYASEGLSQARAVNDELSICNALNNLGEAEYLLGELDQAELHLRELSELAEALGQPVKVALATGNLGTLMGARGKHAEARPLLERAREIHEQTGDVLNQGQTACLLGWTLLGLGETGGAEERFLEGLELTEQVQYRRLTGECLQGLVVVSTSASRPLQAAQLAGVAAALQDAHGFSLDPETRRLADEALSTIELQLGTKAFTEAVDRGRTMPATATEIRTLLGSAALTSGET